MSASPLKFRYPVRACMAMARVVALALSCFIGGLETSSAATLPVFENLTILQNTNIDATTIINRGTINASNSLIFSTLNTLNFTNALGARLNGDLGFQFEYVTNFTRQSADNTVNQGVIQGDSILVNATNVINSGQLRGGGLVQLQGRSMNLSRSVISALDVNSSTPASVGFRLIDTNGLVTYQNPSGVTDVYWGAGTGNVMSVVGSAIALNLPLLEGASGGFRPPSASSPSHEIQTASGGLFGFGGITQLSGTNYASYVFRSQIGTNANVQVVLVQTNSANTNLSVDVRFTSSSGAGNFSAGNTPVLRFSTFGSDITSGGFFTNALYFFDFSSTRTNAVLSDNQVANSSRPAAYNLSRSPANEAFFVGGLGSGLNSNASISDISFFTNDYTDTFITNNFYGAYRIAVGSAASTPGSATYIPARDDPTNQPGRVEITADTLNMSLARIRADNIVVINATNLVGFDGTLIDAPYIQLSVANTNSTLTLTNFAAADAVRPNGQISFYSTTWTNVATNSGLSIRFSVLMVDASQLTGSSPVTLQEFAARGTNIVINNALSIGRGLRMDSPAVTFSATSALNLPLLAATNLVSTNFPNLNFFTNLGGINVPFTCSLGSDRTTPIANFVNRGTITANNISIRATEYESSGTNLTRTLINGTNAAGGPISILADSAKFDGGSAGGLLSAGGSVLLAGNDLKLRNHQLQTAGTLFLSPTNSLTDTGLAGTNRINCSLGFHLTVKPRTGDLLGTTFASSAPFGFDIPHIWAAANVGPIPAGFTNNAAIGRLLLDTGTSAFDVNRLAFYGAGTNNALYVDYLELNGTLTNDLNTHLFIDTNLTLYFANSNVRPEALDGQLGGRLRWVKDFAGPNTGVDVQLRDGRTLKVNVAKLNSQILDSDADGIVNASDLSPFDGIVLDSRVTFTNLPPLTAFVTWEAAAQTVYQVEVNTNLLSGAWQFLSHFTNSAATNRVVTFSESVPVGSLERYYRISYQP